MLFRLRCVLLQPLLSLSLFTYAGTAADINATAPIVDLGYARYRGYFDAQRNITNFLGIRYAAPPLGHLRFQAPQPPDFEPRVQPATQNPNMCYQGRVGLNSSALVPPNSRKKRQSTTPPVSEDCLFLNVFVPGTLNIEQYARQLPVLVWIHGGGYVAGYAAQNNGADLVADSLNSMVVVVIQYRLGVFGFLPGNEVKSHGALNAGLLDQTFALKWVQEHIGPFGGDKSHVTIWGESAGGGSVLQHVVANGGNTKTPLFNAAMASSTFLPSQYHYNDRIPQFLYNEVASMTGCASSVYTLGCLQSVDVETLQTANTNIISSGFFGTFTFVPVVDGVLIVERPTVTLSKGHVNGQVLLAVNNRKEGDIFVDHNETLTITDYISNLFPGMTYEQVGEAVNVYQSYGTALEQAMLVMGDAIFVCPTYYSLAAFAGRAWKGYFAIPPAYHGADGAYYFDSPNDPPPFNNTQFIHAFAQSFMSLARYHDVNKKFDPTNITPHWNKYEIGETEMLFNRTEAGAPVVVPIKTDARLLERCAFWSSVASGTAQ